MSSKNQEKIFKTKYPETGVEMTLYKNGIVEIFYPRPNYSEEENIAETQWIMDQFKYLQETFPAINFYALLNLIGPGNAEDIADESMKLYMNMLKNSKVKRVATFGQTKWYTMLMNVAVKLTKTFNKLKVFDTREEAVKWLLKYINEN
ncbi:MAG: STAS/SEC14 domain-containing protein [Patescibacteria group bacterium]|jgi:hypothetical protein